MIKASPRFRQIRSILGSPACEGEGYAVYCIDCMEAMPPLPPAVIDLTVTSPPYNIGKEYERPLPIEEYVAWSERWFAEVYRLTTAQGAFWLNLGYVEFPARARAVPLPYLLWAKCPFFLVQEVVWNYGAGVAARKALSPRNEKFLWYVKDPANYTFNLDEIRDPDVAYPRQKKRGKLRCNTLGKNPSDVWQIAKVTSGMDRSSPERAPHPAQFPLDLVTRIIKGFSRPGDLILDPFMGSGTTAEACLREGREVIGLEVRRDYCDFIAKRLSRVRESQRSLFGA
jgi:adenine-specific DNA-methyltransferase